jgi:hypothetical protein
MWDRAIWNLGVVALFCMRIPPNLRRMEAIGHLGPAAYLPQDLLVNRHRCDSSSVDRSAQSADRGTRMTNRSRTERAQSSSCMRRKLWV